MVLKKSQSEVITTVLIILLVLAAVFIVYTAVRAMVKGGAEKMDTSPTDISLKASKINAVNFDKISVSRQAGGGEIESIRIIFRDASGVTRTVTKTAADNCIPAELETKECDVSAGLRNSTGGQDFFPVSYEVYPVLKGGVIGLPAIINDNPSQSVVCVDRDGDGFNVSLTGCGTVFDCNDNNKLTNPSMSEIPCNGVDENCNGIADDCPSIQISDCQNLDQTGRTYTLSADIIKTNYMSKACLNFTAEHVTLDCANKQINIAFTSNNPAVAIYSSKQYTNVKNCIITISYLASSNGIEFYDADYSYLFNNTINRANSGISWTFVDNSIIENNSVLLGLGASIFLSRCDSNTIAGNTAGNGDIGSSAMILFSSGSDLPVNNVIKNNNFCNVGANQGIMCLVPTINSTNNQFSSNKCPRTNCAGVTCSTCP